MKKTGQAVCSLLPRCPVGDDCTYTLREAGPGMEKYGQTPSSSFFNRFWNEGGGSISYLGGLYIMPLFLYLIIPALEPIFSLPLAILVLFNILRPLNQTVTGHTTKPHCIILNT